MTDKEELDNMMNSMKRFRNAIVNHIGDIMVVMMNKAEFCKIMIKKEAEKDE